MDLSSASNLPTLGLPESGCLSIRAYVVSIGRTQTLRPYHPLLLSADVTCSLPVGFDKLGSVAEEKTISKGDQTGFRLTDPQDTHTAQVQTLCWTAEERLP